MPYKDPEKKKAYNEQYHREHKEELKAKMKEWYWQNIEKIKVKRTSAEFRQHRKEYRQRPEVKQKEEKFTDKYNIRPEVRQHRHEMYLANLEKIKEQHKKWRKTNKERINQQQKEYYNRPEVKQHILEVSRIRNKRPEVIERRREREKERYHQCPEIREKKHKRDKIRTQRPEVKYQRKKNWKKWVRENPERIRELQDKHSRKRRGLKYIPLNKWFDGSEAHHIDRIHIIYIPRELHHSVWHSLSTGKGMEEINAKVWEWLNSRSSSIQMNILYPSNERNIYEQKY